MKTTIFLNSRLRSLLQILILMSAPAAAVDTQFLQGIGDTRYHHLESEIVGRGYHIYVMLPDDYDAHDSKDYPTLYILDGGGLFPLFSAYYRYLNFGEEIPDAIIVGISYGADDFENGNFRSTDYTAPSTERDHWGGAQKFQRFLSDELFPVIEAGYRARADRRIVFGQSIGGQFVLYTALTQPELFWGHIASNPALHRNLSFFLERFSGAQETGSSKLFVSSGTLDDPQYRQPAQKWIRHWSARSKKPWQLKTIDLEGHTHMSAPPAAFRQGMRWLFSED
jgi:predicted alpha/beta superfamily hydrolase